MNFLFRRSAFLIFITLFLLTTISFTHKHEVQHAFLALAEQVQLAGTPSVNSVTPTQHATGISASSNISIDFSEAIDIATVDADSFIVIGSQSGVHTGAFTYSNGNATAQLNPTDDFFTGENVQVILTTDIQSSSTSSPLDRAYIFEFWVDTPTGFTNFVEDSTTAFNNSPINTDPADVQLADLNADGDLDIILSTAQRGVEFWLGDGAGGFATPTNLVTPTNGLSEAQILVAPMDDNDSPDIVLKLALNIRIFLNNGSGSFPTEMTFDVGAGNVGSGTIATEDFDGDGDIDLAISDTQNNELDVFFSNGVDTMTYSASYALADDYFYISAGDLDNDYDIDIFAMTNNGFVDRARILTNGGTGVFSIGSVFDPDGSFGRVSLAPFLPGNTSLHGLLTDSDGTVDHLSFLENNGSSVFTSSSIATSLHNLRLDTNIGDFNGDDKLDAIIVNDTVDYYNIFVNNSVGSQSFSANGQISISDIGDIISGDLDSDGDLDLITLTDPGATANFKVHLGAQSTPLAVTNLGAAGASGQATLSWTAPGTGGSPITDYVVEYGLTAGFPGNAAVFNDGVSATPGAVVTGLTNGSSYSFRVFAVNAIGTGPSSNVATAVASVSWALDSTDPLLDGVNGSNAVAYDGKIYHFGGSNGGGAAAHKNTVQIYDPNAVAGARWTIDSTDPMPTGLSHGASVLVGDKIYYLMGRPDNSSASDAVYIYDPAGADSSRWTTGTAAGGGFARHSMAFDVEGVIIYLVGGLDGGGTELSTVISYNTSLDTWTTVGLTSLPAARGWITGQNISGTLYVAGGVSSTIYAYDIAGNSWSTKTAYPLADLQSPCSTKYNNEFYVISGLNGDTFDEYLQVYKYNPVGDAWTQISTLNEHRKRCAATTLGDVLYAIAGQDFDTDHRDDFETLDLSSNDELLSPLVSPRNRSIFASDSNDAYGFEFVNDTLSQTFIGAKDGQNNFTQTEVSNGEDDNEIDLFFVADDENNGVYLGYGENYNASNGNWDLYISRVNSSGTEVAGFPVQLASASSFSRNYISKIIPDGANGVFVLYMDIVGNVGGFTSGGAYLAHIDDSGTVSYDTLMGGAGNVDMVTDLGAGVFVVTDMGTDLITGNPGAGVVTYWDDTGQDLTFNSNAGSQVVSTNITSTKSGFVAAPNAGNGTNIYWIDDESGEEGLYYQFIDASGDVDTTSGDTRGERKYASTNLSGNVQASGNFYGEWMVGFEENGLPKVGKIDFDDLLWDCQLQSPTASFAGTVYAWDFVHEISGSDVFFLWEGDSSGDRGLFGQSFDSDGHSRSSVGGRLIDDAVSNGGTDFEVRLRKGSARFPASMIPRGRAASWQHNGVIEGFQYVYAYNDGGLGDVYYGFESINDFTGGPGNDCVILPSVISDLSAIAGNTTVNLSWSAPSLNGGPAITDYLVEFGETSGWPGNAATFVDGVSAVAGTTVSGLTNGTSYSFRVSPITSNGTGSSSNVAVATPVASSGGGSSPEVRAQLAIPVITGLDVLGVESINYTWDYSGSNHLGFRLYNASNEQIATIGSQVRSWTLTSLSHNTSYQGLYIRAYNNVTESLNSNVWSTAVTHIVPVSPQLVARDENIRVQISNSVNNLDLGQSGIQFELLIPETLLTTAAVQQSEWAQIEIATFTGVPQNQEVQVRSRARNQEGVETVWSQYLVIPAVSQDQLETDEDVVEPEPLPEPEIPQEEIEEAPGDEEEPEPLPPPTQEETETIENILTELIDDEVEQTTPELLPNTETAPESSSRIKTRSQSDGRSFTVEVDDEDSDEDDLIISGLATTDQRRIEFSGTTSQPNSVITLIFNENITVVVSSDVDGFWQTFVSAEQLGIPNGEPGEVRVEAIAAKGRLVSEKVSVGAFRFEVSSDDEVVAEFESVVEESDLLTAINTLLEEAGELIEDQEEIIQTTLAVSAPVVLLSSAPLWGYLPYLPTLIYHLITYLIGLIGRRKQEDDHLFGQVYDSITKKPLGLAVLRVYNSETNKLVATKVTDKNGRYDLLLEPANYRIELKKPQYTFPSKIVTSAPDGEHVLIYNADTGVISSEGSITVPDIPVDPVNAKIQWSLANIFKKLWLMLQKVGHYLAVPVLFIGAIVGLLTLISVPESPENWILSVLYVFMFLLQLRLRTKLERAWGVVYDLASSLALPLTTIQLIDPEYGKVVASRLTDYEGRFAFLPEPGKYLVKASKAGYEQAEVVESPDKNHAPMSGEVSVQKEGQRIDGDIAMTKV